MEKKRAKNEILNDHRGWECGRKAFQDLLLEVLIDIRDELAKVSYILENKRLV